MDIVYFSSVSENTHRFVQHLDPPCHRIPLRKTDDDLIVNYPYLLVCPTYGGGASISRQESRPVPVQIIHFLNNETNRSYLRGVVATGNRNFGVDYAVAGDIISKKCHVPYFYRFELMGTPEDVGVVSELLLALDSGGVRG